MLVKMPVESVKTPRPVVTHLDANGSLTSEGSPIVAEPTSVLITILGIVK
jgi:hypothetical protein